MSDTVARLGGSVIQHGKENDRIYLMKLSKKDVPAIIDKMNRLATTAGYTKIIAKVPAYALHTFAQAGYLSEAVIPKFFHNTQDCHFMSRFLSVERMEDKNEIQTRDVLEKAMAKKPQTPPPLPPDCITRAAAPEDAETMAALYKRVFKTYPFPIHEKEYLLKTMDSNVKYFGIWHRDALVALSSCELYLDQSNAEMTDFAISPEYRGQNLSLRLLHDMERELHALSVNNAYTIARAACYGMNITFSKACYKYAGKLVNNTNIGGNIESMHVWYKSV